MSLAYDTNAPKKATNISLNSDLVRQAKAYRINLSAMLEERLKEEIRKRKEQEWLEENREAIEYFNDHIEKHGTFAEQLWRGSANGTI